MRRQLRGRSRRARSRRPAIVEGKNVELNFALSLLIRADELLE
jgi:hypothetical protein